MRKNVLIFCWPVGCLSMGEEERGEYEREREYEKESMRDRESKRERVRESFRMCLSESTVCVRKNGSTDEEGGKTHTY